MPYVTGSFFAGGVTRELRNEIMFFGFTLNLQILIFEVGFGSDNIILH